MAALRPLRLFMLAGVGYTARRVVSSLPSRAATTPRFEKTPTLPDSAELNRRGTGSPHLALPWCALEALPDVGQSDGCVSPRAVNERIAYSLDR